MPALLTPPTALECLNSGFHTMGHISSGSWMHDTLGTLLPLCERYSSEDDGIELPTYLRKIVWLLTVGTMLNPGTSPTPKTIHTWRSASHVPFEKRRGRTILRTGALPNSVPVLLASNQLLKNLYLAG
jgi:hypothetical protein